MNHPPVDPDTRRKTVEMLNMLKQEHLVRYLDTLNEDESTAFIRQIGTLDLSVLEAVNAENPRGEFAPLSAMTLSEINEKREQYRQTGLEAIRAGKVGAVLLAGGQGSRLGYDHPKGTFNIGETKDLFIFECLINNLKEVAEAAGAFVPLFIMTSAENNNETRDFFREHHYFGYSEANVWFFVQEQLPVVDPDGRLMLAENGLVLTAPNGNGGWYASMEKTGMLKVIRDSEICWLNVFALDNVLQHIADPVFIGAVIESGKVSGSKVVAKANPDEHVGVLCLEDGRPSIVEYYEMTDAMRTQREPDGRLSYNYGVILNYLFRVDQLNRTLSVKLPLHRAFKKIKYMEQGGTVIQPEEPNAYKFETLVLDMVRLQKDCLAFEVDRQTEFAPVKNKNGEDSVDTARALLHLNGVEL